MESADGAACVDLYTRHYAGNIAKVRVAGAPAIIVEDNFLSSAECHAAFLSKLHECRIMILRRISGTIAQFYACAHSQCGSGQGTGDLDILSLDRV